MPKTSYVVLHAPLSSHTVGMPFGGQAYSEIIAFETSDAVATLLMYEAAAGGQNFSCQGN